MTDRNPVPLKAPPVPVRFDPVEAWDRLPPEVQRRVGVAAIVGAYARLASLYVDGRRAIGFEAAEIHSDLAIAGYLPPIAVPSDADTDVSLPLPDLAALGVRACRGCGCTDQFGCPEGCSWVAPDHDLCSACDVRIGGVWPW